MKLCENQNELVTEYVLPEKIIISERVKNAEWLLTEHVRQPILGGTSTCDIEKGGYVLFDFGEEFQGGADIVVQNSAKLDENTYSHLRVVFGESVSEAMSSVGEKNAVNDHSPRDMVVEAPFLSHLTLGNTGYRFLKIEAVDGRIDLISVQGISKYRKLEYKGSFRCNDERLNKIWQTGARTVHLNMQEYLWDGIKRDRLIWVGDMHPETSTVAMVFGDTQVVRKSLDCISAHSENKAAMNGIPSYSMWWIKIHRDFYWDFGDKDYLREQLESVAEILEKTISGFDGENSDIDYHFTEWSSAETKDEEAAFYAMLAIGLDAGCEILDILNEKAELKEKCRKVSNVIKHRKVLCPENKQTAAMLGLSGICDLKDMCENVIKPGKAKGLSTFWGYYVLNALFKNGDMDFALDIIRDYWGAMLDLGATTFWEDFDIDWIENASSIDEICPPGKKDIHGDFGKFCYKQFRHSLCHGWASGPTAFLSKKVLGIVPLEAGYGKIKVKPALGNLEFAEGTVPTPYGNIYVKHTAEGNSVKTDIKLPKGIELLK